MKNTLTIVIIFCSLIINAQTVPVSPPKPLYCITSTGQQIQCGGTWVDYNPADGLTYDCNCTCVAGWTQPERCTARPKTKSIIGSNPPGNAQEVLDITPETHSDVTLQGYYLGKSTFTKTPVDATESWAKENDIKNENIKNTTSNKLFIRRKAIPITSKSILRNQSGNRRLDSRLDNDRLYFKNNRIKSTQRLESKDSKGIIAMNKLTIEENRKNYEISLRQENIHVTSSNMIVGNMTEPSLYDFTKTVAIPVSIATAMAFAPPAGFIATFFAGGLATVSAKHFESAAECILVKMPSNEPCTPGLNVTLNENTWKEAGRDAVVGSIAGPLIKPLVKSQIVGKGLDMDLRTKAAGQTTDIITDVTLGKTTEFIANELKEREKAEKENRSSSEQIQYWSPR